MATIYVAAVVELKTGAPLRATSGAKFVLSTCKMRLAVFRANCDAKLKRYPKFASVRCTSVTSRNSLERWSCRRSRHSRAFSSREEIPSEILEDSKFVPITAEDPRFGPPPFSMEYFRVPWTKKLLFELRFKAILLLGFTNEEAVKVQSLLKEMEGDFVEVLLCTEEMANGTLGKAFDAVQPNLTESQVAKGLPRISFLSGLTGEEIMMMIQIFPEAGLDPTVFAAHVPLNSDKSIQELMEEIMDDHQRLNKERKPVEQ